MTDELKIPSPQWVHTLSPHPIGSVCGWQSADSPTGWWSGIVREIGPCCVKVDSILPGRFS